VRPYIGYAYPAGGQQGTTFQVKLGGQGLDDVRSILVTGLGVQARVINYHRRRNNQKIQLSREQLRELNMLPKATEKEPNNDPASVQRVNLPIIVDKCVDRPGDLDMIMFAGRAGEPVVTEINTRRLDSSLDSIIKLTGPDGKLLAFNDDCEDPGSGLNTHHADLYIMATLPAEGIYRVHVGDVARGGGEAYA